MMRITPSSYPDRFAPIGGRKRADETTRAVTCATARLKTRLLGLLARLGSPAAVGAEHRDDVLPDHGVRVLERLPTRQDQSVNLFVNHEDLALSATSFYHRFVYFPDDGSNARTLPAVRTLERRLRFPVERADVMDYRIVARKGQFG
jgi:hypothetical protein